MASKARYVGPGYLSGIPARHLSDEEYAALDAEQRKAVRDSGLYRMVEAEAAEKPKGGESRERAGGGE